MEYKDVLIFLAPFLPYLAKSGEAFAGKIGEELGAKAWEKAKLLWSKLRPRLDADPEAKELLEKIANDPGNQKIREALMEKLADILESDEKLTGELCRMVVAVGDRSVAIGGDLNNSIIITGDRNKTEK